MFWSERSLIGQGVGGGIVDSSFGVCWVGGGVGVGGDEDGDGGDDDDGADDDEDDEEGDNGNGAEDEDDGDNDGDNERVAFWQLRTINMLIAKSALWKK